FPDEHANNMCANRISFQLEHEVVREVEAGELEEGDRDGHDAHDEEVHLVPRTQQLYAALKKATETVTF
ncbi:hypothetical protein AVEN_232368-1, partial [Araneus ventricosus]